MTSDGVAELEAAHLLLNPEGQEHRDSTVHGRRKLVGIILSVALVGLCGVAHARTSTRSISAGDVVELASSKGYKAAEAEAFAVIPMKWTIIHKKDGTGKLLEATVKEYVTALNTHYSGKGNDKHHTPPDVEAILKSDSCYDKCNVALCYKGGKAVTLDTREKIVTKCGCSDNYCQDWGFQYNDEKASQLHGPNTDTGISFTLENVTYVENDVWHSQCCCTHADLKYEVKQNEIFDQVIDKDTVRKFANIIICDMSTLGGNTAGQSMIGGSKGCEGGPGIMMDFGSAKHVEYGQDTLVHEFGHHFGLYHTFNEECGGNFGDCTKEDACKPEKNKGDHISDTPLHLKQGSCNGADSCPNAPGKDPLDNYMSYSGCTQRRFTSKQVEKMHEIITKYYPAMLVSPNKPEEEDLPCNPSFPSGVVPSGYAPTPPPSQAHTDVPFDQKAVSPPSCALEVGQCDKHDTTGCYCADARNCCPHHGCGGSTPGYQQCLPCLWKSWGTDFTADSCK